MSYFDDASLVFIPSGTKTSKAYSVKPIDGTGDLTFTRSNDTATRVNSAGLIEKVRTNLAQRSDAFDNAYWIKSASSVTANATTNPLDGATNADKLVESATTASHFIYNSSLTPAAVNHTYSVYAKAAERTSIQLVSFNGSTDAVGLFNLSTGVVTTQTNGIARIESVGGGWYRCSITHTNAYVASASDYWGQIFLVDGSGNTNYAGDGTSGLFIFGAQFEVSDFGATDYIATTSAAVSVGLVANVPRLDYLNSSCPRLLLEPQRTNLALYSEQMDNASWIKLNGAVTANAAVSPDGYTNADSFVPNTTSGVHALRSNLFNQSATAAHSWFVKANGYSKVAVRESELVGNYASFNLATGTLISTNQTGSIVNYGNGWYRLTLVDTTTGANAQTSIVVLPDSYTTGDPMINWSGDGTKGVLTYGAMVEIGAYATSYIPTLGSTSTRASDACSKTGISSLIGQTEGVLFYDFVWNGATTSTADYPIVLSGSDFNNFIGLNSTFNSNQLLAYSGGSAVASISGADFVIGQRYKIALAYKANDFVYYVNGTLQGSDTSGAVPIGLANLQMVTPFGSKSTVQNANSILFFKTRLTNAQLAELTSL